jgi:hypothetical protein
MDARQAEESGPVSATAHEALSSTHKWLVAALLAATIAIRLAQIDQPIVENYVGRQIPTAMVARNLERGSGLLWPQLDTAPFPSYFVVEPPIYECGVVALRRATGMTLEQSGRALSALATALAGWGLFVLVRGGGGTRAALLALMALAVFPLTARYGRAFQPDATMLGAGVAGLACWDRFSSSGRRRWLVAGWVLLALGIATKIIAACLLVPLLLVGLRPWRARHIAAACATLLPAILWYTWAGHLIAETGGSLAASDNQRIWLGVLGPAALARTGTWIFVFRFLFLRGFTPLGAVLAMWGLVVRSRAGIAGCRVWWAWAGAAMITLAALAGKLHHEYYFLILAPVAAAGVGYALDRLAALSRRGCIATSGALLVLCVSQARSTWRTPDEWRNLVVAARAVSAAVPPGTWIVAPEALLFQADRRGCRLEWAARAAQRAAAEWGAGRVVDGPVDLVECYRRAGARYFADLGASGFEPERMALHEEVRRRYKVIVDRPEVIVADLVAAEMLPHAN